MKKLFITSAFALTVSLGLYSCNNGIYDTDPTVDNSAAQNPISPTSGTTVYIGSMEAMINGVMVLFSPVYHVTDTFNTRRVYAYGKDDSVYHRSLVITYPVNTFIGISTDTIGKAAQLSFEYMVYDPDNKYYKTYVASPSNNSNNIIVDVKGVEGGHMRGTIEGNLMKTLPLAAPADSASFTKTEFYSEKKAFPYPL